MQLRHVALDVTDPAASAHIGCELGSAEDVRLAGADELESWDEDGDVSLEVADPDGHHVEVFWEVV